MSFCQQNGTSENISSIASATVGASTFFKGITPGYLLAKHLLVKMYLWPHFVLGSGPTRSIATQLKGSVITGKGLRSAFPPGAF